MAQGMYTVSTDTAWTDSTSTTWHGTGGDYYGLGFMPDDYKLVWNDEKSKLVLSPPVEDRRRKKILLLL